MGALAAVSTQTGLVNYVDALKKAKYVQGAKSSFDATTNAVSKLLDRFKLFGACAAALKSALTLPGGGPKAATVAKDVLLPKPAALFGPPSFPLPKAGPPMATRKRQLATMQSSGQKSTADKDFVVSDNHNTDSSTDDEEESQSGSGTAPDQVNPTDQDEDEDDDDDEKVPHA